MKVVAVTGGKGGTGKTVIAVSLAKELSKKLRTVLVDVDVENPCTYTLFKNYLKKEGEIEVKAFKPVFDEAACRYCAICAAKCPAHAIAVVPSGKLLFFEGLCEGCGICFYVCPHGAVKEGEAVLGHVRYFSAGSLRLIVGELVPGQRRYIEVAEATLDKAKELWNEVDVAVIDTPPGTGRVVYRVLSLADYVIEVTEPTRLGLADLKRLRELVKLVSVKREAVVLNKADIPGGIRREVLDYAHREGLDIFEVPFDMKLAKAYSMGFTVLEKYPDSPSAKAIAEIVSAVKRWLETG